MPAELAPISLHSSFSISEEFDARVDHMITFRQWQKFCEQLRDSGANILTARDFVKQAHDEKPTVVIKHDVEALPEKALVTAQLEARCDVASTFYFHGFFARDSQAAVYMQDIRDLGHEVAYHYDVLDLNDGNFALALEEFERDLQQFAAIGCPISTVCPHGNPLKQRSGWSSNKDFFKDPSIRERFPMIFDIVNDIGSLAPEFRYISDAGFSFKEIGDIRDNDKQSASAKKDREISANCIVELCQNGPTTVISVHSHRMSNSRFAVGVRKTVFKVLRGGVRFVTRSQLIRKILSPLFAYSKRF